MAVIECVKVADPKHRRVCLTRSGSFYAALLTALLGLIFVWYGNVRACWASEDGLDNGSISRSLTLLTEQLQQQLGFTSFQNDGMRVEHVFTGSNAFLSGLEPGDLLEDARIENGEVVLEINRRGDTRTIRIQQEQPKESFRLPRPGVQPQPQSTNRYGQSATMMGNQERNGEAQGPPSFDQRRRLPNSEEMSQPYESAHPLTAAPQGSGAGQPFELKAQRSSMADQLEQGRMDQARQGFDLNAQRLAASSAATRQRDQFPIVAVNPKVRMLGNFDLELIVDRSMSMRRRDCPGFLSRWDWCGQQAEDLSRQLTPYVPQGMSITSFASRFEEYEQATPQVIKAMFEHTRLGPGTRLAEPLAARLNKYFNQYRPGAKPLLVAVVTDGLPFPMPEPDLVARELVKASRRMNSAHQVTVVFLQIGGQDPIGRQYLRDLDTRLGEIGAKYDLVRMVGFERLQSVGLAHSLVQAIEDFAGQVSRDQGAPVRDWTR